MDLRPSDEQLQLIDAFGALYAKESTAERVREAEPLGFDHRLWSQLVELGALSMAVDEAHGGWGASLLDLELVAEEHGRALGPAPLLEAQVACRLLARSGRCRRRRPPGRGARRRAPAHGVAAGPRRPASWPWCRPVPWPRT